MRCLSRALRYPRPVRSDLRLLAGSALLAGWLALLLHGHAGGGAVHLLAVAGLVLWPWRR